MTAVHVYRQDDAVHVLTDGAAYDGEGVVYAFAQKVITFPHLNAVVACTGPSFILVHLAARMHDAFTSFDELVAGFVSQVRNSMQADASIFARVPAGPAFILYLAGISETRGPEAYLLASHGSDGFHAWTLEPLGQGIIKPGDPAFLAEVTAMYERWDVEELMPAIHGLEIMEAQRRRRWTIVGLGHKRHTIGGFAQLTTVSADGTSMRIIRRWPDRVGERIDPKNSIAADMPSPEPALMD